MVTLEEVQAALTTWTDEAGDDLTGTWHSVLSTAIDASLTFHLKVDNGADAQWFEVTIKEVKR